MYTNKQPWQCFNINVLLRILFTLQYDKYYEII